MTQIPLAVAVAQVSVEAAIPPLAQELPYPTSVAPTKKKKKRLNELRHASCLVTFEI